MTTTRPLDDEVAAILADPDKHITGDLRWTDDEDASGHEFLAPVTCVTGDLLVVRGQRCASAGSLRFALVLRGVGRIAALDLAHPRPRFHLWSPGRRDPPADLPELATLDPDDERAAWSLFCHLTHITHDGELAGPPATQETLL